MGASKQLHSRPITINMKLERKVLRRGKSMWQINLKKVVRVMSCYFNLNIEEINHDHQLSKSSTDKSSTKI